MNSAATTQKTPRVWHVILLFAVAFSLMTALLGLVASRANPKRGRDELFFAKLKYFSDRKNDFDAVFIGPSKVHRQIDPETFDLAVGAVLPGFHSFNLGVPALNWMESVALLERIREARSKRLKYIFVYPDADLSQHAENGFTYRTIALHDLSHTFRAIQSTIRSENDTFIEKTKLIGLHIQALLAHLVHFGQISAVFSMDIDDQEKNIALHRGFTALDDESGSVFRDRREKFLRQLVDYKFDVTQVEGSKMNSPSEPELLLIRQLVSLIRETGAVPILLAGPELWNRFAFRPGVSQLDPRFGCSVISLASPSKYGALYEVSNHWDYNHLNRTGATLYSKEVAHLFSSLVSYKSAETSLLLISR